MTERLTADEERAIATQIRALEDVARETLERVPLCRSVRARNTRTRVGQVQRLLRMVEVAEDLCRGPDADLDTVSRSIAASEAWREAQGLRWRLATSATRVAIGEAKKLRTNQFLSVEDLVQEGRLGLLDAATRFEPDRGVRFTTYARWWARARMTRAIDQARHVRASAGALEKLWQLRKLLREADAAGETPSPAELAERLDVSLERLREVAALDRPGIAQIGAHSDEWWTTGRPDGGDQGYSANPDADQARARVIQAAIADHRTPFDATAEAEEARRVRAALPTLDARTFTVIAERYGLQGEPRTLSDIARGLHLSCERVRQIERDGLEQLRDAMRGRLAG